MNNTLQAGSAPSDVCKCVCDLDQSVHIPLAVAVHAVETVPLGVELREGVSDLGHLGGRGVPDDVGLALVDPGDLLAQTLQVLFDVLQTKEGEVKDKEAQ